MKKIMDGRKIKMLPLYKRIRESILSDILSGKLRESERIPSEWKITQRYKVNRSTVRRALDGLVQEGVLSRVPGMGTFVSKPGQARRNKTRRIAFVFANEHLFSKESYHSMVFEGIQREAQSENFELLFSFISNSDSRASVVSAITKSGEIDGIILSATLTSGIINEIRKLNIPSVLYGIEYKGVDIDTVIPDNVKGAYDLTAYLIRLGHRKIAYAYVREDMRFEQRLDGYSQALKNSGINFDTNLIWEYKGSDSVNKNISSLSPTAIFGANDVIAIEIIKSMQKSEKKIPEDISIAGFDDRNFAGYCTPALTTVKIPKEEMGRSAVKLLLDRINNPGNKSYSKILLSAELVIRDSCVAVNR